MANKDFYYQKENVNGDIEYKKINLGTEGQLLSVTSEGDIGLDNKVYQLQTNSISPVSGNNIINSEVDASTIGGGLNNCMCCIYSNYSTISGGRGNCTAGGYSVVGGGRTNTTSGAAYSVIAGGNYNRMCSSSTSFIGGGECNTTGFYPGSVIAGGSNNLNFGLRSFLGGGQCNSVDANSSFGVLAGGQNNFVNTDHSSIVGGKDNRISQIFGAPLLSPAGIGRYSSIVGGEGNCVISDYSVIIGGREAKTDLYGESAFSSGKFSNVGDAQVRKLVLSGITGTGIGFPTLGGIDRSHLTSRILIPQNTSWLYKIEVVARNEENGTTDAFVFDGVIESSSVGAVILQNNKTVIYTDENGEDCNLNIIDYLENEYLNIQTTGPDGTQWVAYATLIQNQSAPPAVGGSCCCCSL